MAQYWDGFGSYMVDAEPPNYTKQWHQTVTGTVRADAGATDGQILELTSSTSDRSALSWDDIDSDTNRDNVEVSIRFRHPSNIGTSESSARIAVRGSGGSTSETGYTMGWFDGSSRIRHGRYLNANFSDLGAYTDFGPLTEDVWYRQTIRINGSDLKSKIWLDGDPEPDWQLEQTNTDISGVGWVGFFLFDGSIFTEVDWIGVGTNGDPAPTSAPSGGADHALDATDIESATQVSSPAITQAHDLAPVDTESTTSVSSPSLAQVHSLNATSVDSASSTSALSLSEAHQLSATDVESASSTSSPAISQSHSLTATNTQSATSTDSPALAQNHSLTSTDTQATSEVSVPSLTSGVDHALSAVSVESASSVTAPTLAQAHSLQSLNVSSVNDLSSPVLQQVHDLTGLPIESASTLSSPTLTDSSQTLGPVRNTKATLSQSQYKAQIVTKTRKAGIMQADYRAEVVQ